MSEVLRIPSEPIIFLILLLSFSILSQHVVTFLFEGKMTFFFV